MSDFDFIMGLREQTPEYRSSLPLVGINGNAFAVMAQVQKGLRQAGAPREYIAKAMNEMMDSDYDHLLSVAVRYTVNP